MFNAESDPTAGDSRRRGPSDAGQARSIVEAHRDGEGDRMPQVPKFVQITATQRGDGSPVLYALDETGRVWWLSPNEQEWRLVSDARTANVEEPSPFHRRGEPGFLPPPGGTRAPRRA